MDKLKCITVDDDPLSLSILSMLINQHPELELVNQADNYFDGMNRITEIQPDIVFLDINMPELTGPELFDILITKPLVIIVSADASYINSARPNEHFIDHLHKPVNPRRFKEAVESARLQKLLTKIELAS